MSKQRKLLQRVRRGFVAAATVCAIGGVALADPPASRDYPPTYSSRKTPWYAPLASSASKEKTPTKPIAMPKIEPSKPIQLPMVESMPGAAPIPAWKWYGYGGPTPGANPLAPNGAYPGVSGNWYSFSGATPGAIPHGRLESLPATTSIPDSAPLPHLPERFAPPIRLESPTVFHPPVGGPTLPGPIERPPTAAPANVDGTSSAASLCLPTTGQTDSSSDRPSATLKAPVAPEPIPAPMPGKRMTPRTPAEAIRPPGPEYPDIPVVPAPDVKGPPLTRSAPGAVGTHVARAQAPQASAADQIRQACRARVRLLEIVDAGGGCLIVRLSGSVEDARAVRDHLAGLPELVGLRIEFDLVTPIVRSPILADKE